MQLNGGIDRDHFGVDFKRETYGQDDREINFKDAFKVEIRILGNVPIQIAGNIDISLDDEIRCFENVAFLDYVQNKTLEWIDTDVVDPVYRIEVLRWFIVQKPDVK